MYIVVHYQFPVSPCGHQNGQGCQTISSLWPDVSDGQSWRKRQTSHRRQNPARMPRHNSSQQNPGRQTRGRSSTGRASSSPGSGGGMTAGTVTRNRAVIREVSATISGEIILRGHSRRHPPKRGGRRRISMLMMMIRDKTALPSRAGTTGAAGPRKRSSKSGPTIFTANRFSCALHPPDASFSHFSVSERAHRYS